MGRQKATIHYIYKTTCLVTGRYYIGMHSTCNMDDGYLGSGKRLRYSIRKYGRENHVREIIEFCESRDLLSEREKQIVNSDLIKDIMCMNLGLGGTGGFLTEEQKNNCIRKGKLAFIEKLNTDDVFHQNWKKKLSESVRKTYKSGKHNHIGSVGFSGKTHSNQTKLLMSVKKRGKGVGETNSQHGTVWITKDNQNKKIKKDTLDSWLKLGWTKGRR